MTGPLTTGAARRITLDAAGDPLAALQTGEPGSAPVLLIPGYTGSKEDFAPLLDPLAAAGYLVTAVDLPGQFESPALPAGVDYTPDRLAEPVRAVAHDLGGAVRLLGHSFGGLVARAAVIAEPGLFASLVLLSSGPAQLRGTRRVSMDGLEPVLASAGLPGVYAAMQAAAMGDPAFVAPSPELAEFLERRFLGGSPDMLQGMADALRGEPDRVAELAATDVATLVVYGEDDDAWPPAEQADMARRLGARHAVVPAAAHSPAVENPEALSAVLLGFWGRITGVSDDVGYFGPDSVTWRIHGEPVSMVGGLRALLLQALHPEAMQLLAARSNFQDDPWQRLESTVHYIGTVSFAPRAQVDAAAQRVRSVHHALGIDDPDHLAWVQLCLVDSFLVTARAAGLRLSRADADRYVIEQARSAALVGVPEDRVPRTADAVRAAVAGYRPRLRCIPQAREAARLVVAPPMPVPGRYVLPARLGWSTVSALAVGLLPGWALRLYRLPAVPGRTLATAAGLRALRGTVRALPTQYREGPLYRKAKERAAAG